MRNNRTRARLVALIGAALLALSLAAGCAAEPPAASEPAEPQAGSFDMRSYTVTLPEPLASECSFTVGEESPSPGQTWVGDTVSAMRDGSALFTVACYSDDWGPQGMFRSLKLGPSTAIEGTSVWLLQPMEDQQGEELPDQRETYATYVTLR